MLESKEQIRVYRAKTYLPNHAYHALQTKLQLPGRFGGGFDHFT